MSLPDQLAANAGTDRRAAIVNAGIMNLISVILSLGNVLCHGGTHGMTCNRGSIMIFFFL